MKNLILAIVFIPSITLAQDPCFSPGCGPIADPTGPAELCLPSGCTSVNYQWVGDIATSNSILSNGYQVIGWAGPCKSVDRTQCPNILNQAFDDLTTNALRVNRLLNF